MKKFERRSFVKNSLLVGMSLAFAPSLAKAERLFATEIRSLPFKIQKPGTYVIPQDLITNLSEGAAIEIVCDDVVLDLNGHTISSSNFFQTKAVGLRIEGRDNVTVSNGRFNGFYVGCFVGYQECGSTASHIVLNELHFSRMKLSGIFASADDLTIERCRVAEFGDTRLWYGSIGIYAYGFGSLVSDCSVVVAERQTAARAPRFGIVTYSGEDGETGGYAVAASVKNSSVINCEVGFVLPASFDESGQPINLSNSAVGTQIAGI